MARAPPAGCCPPDRGGRERRCLTRWHRCWNLSEGTPMQTYKLTSLPIEQIDDLEGFAWNLGEFFAARSYPLRLVVTTRPFRRDEPIRAFERDQKALAQLARAGGPVLAAVDAGGDPHAIVQALDDA